MRDATIRADHLQLALVARRIAQRQQAGGENGCRWAAMSAHVTTQDCNRRGGTYRIPAPPMLTPMSAGRIDRAIERVRMLDGLDGVRRVFGRGVRAMRAGAESAVMR